MSARTIGHLLKEIDLPGKDVAGDRVLPFERKPKPVAAKVEDETRKYDDVFQAGKQAGYAAAVKDYETRLAEQQVRHDEQLERERQAWLDEQAALLANGVPQACQNLEDSVTGVVAKLLEPFLATAIRDQAVAEFSERLSLILSDRICPAFRVTGPHELIEAVKRKIKPNMAAIEYRFAETKELRAVADQTVIETQIQKWIQRLKESIR